MSTQINPELFVSDCVTVFRAEAERQKALQSKVARLKAKLMKRQEVGDVVKVPETAEASATSQEEEGSETEEEGPSSFLLPRATTGKQPINVTETNKRLADKRDQQIREEVN